jgi:hypothetical protein
LARRLSGDSAILSMTRPPSTARSPCSRRPTCWRISSLA